MFLFYRNILQTVTNMNLGSAMRHWIPKIVQRNPAGQDWTWCNVVAQPCPTLCNPMDCSLPGFSVHGDSLGKDTGVGCHAHLLGIFPTQGSNSGFPHCRWDSLHTLLSDHYVKLAGSLEGGGTISKETTKNTENDLSVVKEKSRKRVLPIWEVWF